MSGFGVDWRGFVRSRPTPIDKADVILLANAYWDMEQGGMGDVDIAIVPAVEGVEYTGLDIYSDDDLPASEPSEFTLETLVDGVADMTRRELEGSPICTASEHGYSVIPDIEWPADGRPIPVASTDFTPSP